MAMSFSFWEYDTFLSNLDIVVLGSGIVGLNAAISLREQYPNARILVLERGSLPTGASTKNAGFSCFGSISELLEDLQTQSASEVWALVERRYRGLVKLRNRLGDAAMDYKPYGNYELFLDTDAQLYEECLDVLPQFNAQLEQLLGLKNVFQTKNEALSQFQFGKHVKQLLWNSAEGQLHTGKMMQSLLQLARSQHIEILNGLEVTQLEDDGKQVALQLRTGQTIYTRRLLVATNGFARQLLPNLEVQPARNQVIVTAPIPDLKLQGCFHYDKGYVYFRNIGNRILLGGGRNTDLQTEATSDFGLTPNIQSYLETILHTHLLPNIPTQIEHRWSGIMGLGSQKKPIIEQVSPNVTVSVRMGGMGVAIGILVGEEGAKMVQL